MLITSDAADCYFYFVYMPKILESCGQNGVLVGMQTGCAQPQSCREKYKNMTVVINSKRDFQI